jgi:hypothetical protein
VACVSQKLEVEKSNACVKSQHKAEILQECGFLW